MMNQTTDSISAGDWDVYASPGTGHSLERVGELLRCQATREEFPIRGGIPHFLRFAPVESAEEGQTLARLNQRAPEIGWKAAMGEAYGADSGIYRYVTDEGRAIFLNLLPLTVDTRVLEIGPGLGQFTGLLAARARQVDAVEVVAGQAAFVVERMRQAGLTNVRIACGGDDCALPYKSGSFDLVVLNLVLEWCASRNPAEAAVTGQERMLGEMVRVLKPGGSIYLATKNRYALHYVLGGPDEHSFELRFGSALPRWMLRARLRLAGKGRPPGLLHSHAALGRMLRAAGLAGLRSYWATPEMRYPTQMVPTDAASIREARRRGLVQGANVRTRIVMRMMPAALVKYFTPGLAYIATKPTAGK
jgi:SAM-dependent methyltransferase